MSSKRTPLLIALIALAVLAGVFYYSYQANKSRYIWNDSWTRHAYNETSDQPYGIQILYRLLSSYFEGKKRIDIQKDVATELPQDSLSGSTYLFVGEAMYLDSLDTERLLQFVDYGNTAFIASKTIPSDLMSNLYDFDCYELEWDDYIFLKDSVVALTLREPASEKMTARFAIQNLASEYNWHYIEGSYFCDSVPHQPLGYLNDTLVNFAEFPYGQGRFLLHTNPVVFTNYNLLQPATRVYAEGVLSWLPEGDIYWDAVSRVPEAAARRRNRSAYLDEEHPLTFILRQQALAWAWYILAALAVIWLIFRAKRRQRIIPVLPKNENSSYEFIGTIANLHFREKNYQGLCIQNMKLFLAQLRERYGIVATIEPKNNLPRADDDFYRRLATTSEVPEQHIRDIFTQYSAAVRYQPTEEMMVDLHRAMEAFFKHAK